MEARQMRFSNMPIYRTLFAEFEERMRNRAVPGDWLAAFERFLSRAHECGKLLSVQSVNQLIIALCNDADDHRFKVKERRHSRAIVLREVLFWHPKTTNPDKLWFQKDAYFFDKYLLDPDQLRAARAWLAPMVYSNNQHDWTRTPQMHYRPRPEGIVAALAVLVGKSVDEVRAVVYEPGIGIVPKPDTQVNSPKTDFGHSGTTVQKRILVDEANSPKTLTESKTNNETDSESESNNLSSLPKKLSVSEKLLIDAGMDADVAATWADVPVDVVTAVIASMRELAKKEPIWNKTKYLNKCLVNQQAVGWSGGTGDAGIAPTVREYYTGDKYGAFIETADEADEVEAEPGGAWAEVEESIDGSGWLWSVYSAFGDCFASGCADTEDGARVAAKSAYDERHKGFRFVPSFRFRDEVTS